MSLVENKKIYTAIRLGILLFFLTLGLTLSGCQQLGSLSWQDNSYTDFKFSGDEPEYGCSYFYFLWGRQAELGQRYEEALEAYEKALICDPQAYYIMQKMPVLLLQMAKNEEAITWLDKYLSLYPKATGSRMLLAKVFIRLSQFDEAAAQYRLIHEQNPDDHSSLILLSEMYLSLNRFVDAEKTLYGVLDGDDHTYGAHLLLGQTYRSQKKFEKSLQHYELALAENWSIDLLLEIADLFVEQQMYERALEQYEKILKVEEDNDKARASKVHVYLLQKKHDQALVELNKLRESSEKPSRVDLAIAKIYINMNHRDKAIPVLKEILEQEENAEARFLLGFLYFQKELYSEALDELGMISVSTVNFRESVYLRVRIYRVLKKIDQAVALLEQAISKEDGHSVDMFIMLAVLYQQQDQIELSHVAFAKGIKMYPDDIKLLYEYGLFLDSNGKQSDAIVVMKKVIRKKNDHAAALNYVGYTWADKGKNLEKALEYISKAVKLKPDNGYIRDSLGWVFFRLGRLDDALAELQKAVKLSADDPAIFEHLGDVFQKMGKVEESLQAYRKSLGFSDDKVAKDKVRKKIQMLESLEKNK